MSDQDREIAAKLRDSMEALHEAIRLANAAGYGGVILEKFEDAERALCAIVLDLA